MSSSDLVHEGMASPTNTPGKERQSLTLDQRRALRRWAGSQPTRPSHKQCIEWFQQQYNQIISQSTVSHSLSPKYARLDGDPQLSGSRLRLGNWPDVEKLVLLWHQQMAAQGRTPSNDELAEKAKVIFTQLPRYKDDEPPEFSPGWIHRFKKRYGLLIRRQRRQGSTGNQAEDFNYLVDTVPRFLAVSPDTSPSAVKDAIQRMIGLEHSLALCARVRDEICLRQGFRGDAAAAQQVAAAGHLLGPPQTPGAPSPQTGVPVAQNPADPGLYTDEDPEVVLQNALRALQQDEADAEAQAAIAREERERGGGAGGAGPGGLGNLSGQAYAQHAAAAVHAALSTPVNAGRAGLGTPSGGVAGAVRTANGAGSQLQLTPIPSDGPVSSVDQPVRCPFCVNQRMLRNIKEAVEHLSSHVIV